MPTSSKPAFVISGSWPKKATSTRFYLHFAPVRRLPGSFGYWEARTRVTQCVILTGSAARPGMLRNYAGIGNSKLFSVSVIGTKMLIHEVRRKHAKS